MRNKNGTVDTRPFWYVVISSGVFAMGTPLALVVAMQVQLWQGTANSTSVLGYFLLPILAAYGAVIGATIGTTFAAVHYGYRLWKARATRAWLPGERSTATRIGDAVLEPSLRGFSGSICFLVGVLLGLVAVTT